MKIINNITEKLSDDLHVEISPHSKVSIAAACFSVYAYEELKEQLEQVDSLRFIFTSPTFLSEPSAKEKREFYIPRQAREKTLHGSEFEIRLRNEFTQKTISKECADWVRRKAQFKSNCTDETMPGFLAVDSDHPVAYAPACRRSGEQAASHDGQRVFRKGVYLDRRGIAHREQGRGCRFPAPRPCSFFVLAWTIRKPFLRV